MAVTNDGPGDQAQPAATFAASDRPEAIADVEVAVFDGEAVLFEFTQSEALRRHARGVEEAMRAYARWFGIEDPAEVEKWGIVGLLHDFDYEQNPTEDTHLHVGCRILRERGFPEEIVQAIGSHASASSAKAIFDGVRPLRSIWRGTRYFLAICSLSWAV